MGKTMQMAIGIAMVLALAISPATFGYQLVVSAGGELWSQDTASLGFSQFLGGGFPNPPDDLLALPDGSGAFLAGGGAVWHHTLGANSVQTGIGGGLGQVGDMQLMSNNRAALLDTNGILWRMDGNNPGAGFTFMDGGVGGPGTELEVLPNDKVVLADSNGVVWSHAGTPGGGFQFHAGFANAVTDIEVLNDGTFVLAEGNAVWWESNPDLPVGLTQLHPNLLNPITDLIALPSSGKTVASTSNGDIWMLDPASPGNALFINNILGRNVVELEVLSNDLLVIGDSNGDVWTHDTNQLSGFQFVGNVQTVYDIEVFQDDTFAIAGSIFGGSTWWEPNPFMPSGLSQFGAGLGVIHDIEATVPEPGSLALIGLGGVALLLRRRQ